MRSGEHTLFFLGRKKPCMRTLVARDAASPFGTCSKLLSHGRVIYQITFSDASEKSDFFFFLSFPLQELFRLSQNLDDDFFDLFRTIRGDAAGSVSPQRREENRKISRQENNRSCLTVIKHKIFPDIKRH